MAESILGSKAGAGVWQTIVNRIPPHDTLISLFAGHCKVARAIRPCRRLILCEADPETCRWWDGRLPDHAELRNCDGLQLLRDLAAAGSADDVLGGDAGRVVIYADPPYHPDTRTSSNGYNVDWDADTHDEFLDVAATLPATMATLISGYFHEVYAAALADWIRIDFQAMTRGGVRTESLWQNFEPGELHDYRWLGQDKREREKLAKRERRLIRRLKQLPAVERERILSAVAEEFGRDAPAGDGVERWVSANHDPCAELAGERVAGLGGSAGTLIVATGARATGCGVSGSREATSRDVSGPSHNPRVHQGIDIPRSPDAVAVPRGGRSRRNGRSRSTVSSCDAAGSRVVLSLFSGVGLLDRAFSSAGFCVVSGPEKITGGDIRSWRGVAAMADGVVAGPPCQGFSAANMHRSDSDHHSVQNSREMLQHTCRIIAETRPLWFVIENVPNVPDVRIDGYQIQRLNISDWECGGVQIRTRTIQFGHRDDWIIRPERVNDHSQNRKKGRPLKSVTTKTDRWTDFPDHCRKQGLDGPIVLPGWTKSAKFRAVGNGVPLKVGRAVAAAVLCAGPRKPSDCPCGCGRLLSGKQKSATATCRKRLQLQRERARDWVGVNGFHEGEMRREADASPRI